MECNPVTIFDPNKGTSWEDPDSW